MTDFEFKIRTIKSESASEIEHFVGRMVVVLREIEGLESSLRSYLEESGIYINEQHSGFFDLVLLSCILADIGTQMSPFWRKSNVDKIRSICEKRNLNYNLLVRVTSYSDEILQIIDSITNSRLPVGKV